MLSVNSGFGVELTETNEVVNLSGFISVVIFKQ